MSNGLFPATNYLIPQVGTPRGYVYSAVLTATATFLDFRSILGGSIDAQPFRPAGVFIDNSQGVDDLVIVVNEISYRMICPAGEQRNLQFPAPVDATFNISGDGQATVVFVDFPVMPFGGN